MQVINPAYVGYRADLSVTLLSRNQWVGVEGAPNTNTFSVNGRLRNGLGIGTTFVNDKIGLLETNNVNVDASYTLVTSEFGRLSFGLKGGMTFFNNNLSQGVTPDGEIYASTSGNYPNVGLGAFYSTQKIYVGFSIPYLFETPQFYINDAFNEIKLAEHTNYFLTMGGLFPLSEDLKFKPSTMIRYTSNQPLSVDANFNFFYKDLYEAGLSYRHQTSISAMFAVILNKKFRVGYAYDQKFNLVGGGLSTHEIILQLDLDLNRNTRWLKTNICYF